MTRLAFNFYVLVALGLAFCTLGLAHDVNDALKIVRTPGTSETPIGTPENTVHVGSATLPLYTAKEGARITQTITLAFFNALSWSGEDAHLYASRILDIRDGDVPRHAKGIAENAHIEA